MTIMRALKTAISVLCLVVLIWGIAIAGNGLKNKYSEESLKAYEDTVRKYAVQCYALEGSYPESLDYLARNYALELNEDYVYHYEFIADNMMPDITVFPKD